jgi:hypothetical protein
MAISIVRLIACLHADRRATTLPEFTIVMVVFLGMTFMMFEFGFAFYQWIATEKATQIGARFAAVRGAPPGLPESIPIAGSDFRFGDRCITRPRRRSINPSAPSLS